MGKGIVVVNGRGAANAASVSDDASCRALFIEKQTAGPGLFFDELAESQNSAASSFYHRNAY